MSGCPSCQYPVELDWAACRRCGTALPTVLEVQRVTMPASLPRRVAARPVAAWTRHATTAPVRLAPSDTLLPRATTPPLQPVRRTDTWVPKVPSGRTVVRNAGIVAAVVSAALGVRRLLRHRS